MHSLCVLVALAIAVAVSAAPVVGYEACEVYGCTNSLARHCGNGVYVCNTHNSSCASCLHARAHNLEVSSQYRDALTEYHRVFFWDSLIYYIFATVLLGVWVFVACTYTMLLGCLSGFTIGISAGGLFLVIWSTAIRAVLARFIHMPPLSDTFMHCLDPEVH